MEKTYRGKRKKKLKRKKNYLSHRSGERNLRKIFSIASVAKEGILSLLIFITLAYSEPRFGLASWYGAPWERLNVFTASSEVFSPYKFTCATRDYPFGTYLKVTNLKNGKWVIVRVNDRGPASYLKHRIVDLTKVAFSQIADLKEGVIPVKVEVMKKKKEICSFSLLEDIRKQVN